MPINTSLFTLHNFVFIGVIAVLVHVFAKPLYSVLDNKISNEGN